MTSAGAGSPFRLLSHATAPIPLLAPRDAAWDPALAPALLGDDDDGKLAAPGALVVTTGQQPGLFTGPLYTVHKALAARALARRLERDWGRPVVPLFWLAGDDHDYAEASTASWLDAEGRLDAWSLPPRAADAPQHAMAREPLVAIAEGLDHLERSLPEGPDRDRTLAWLRRWYRSGATIHGAYAGALAELLAPWGVRCLDATHPAVKRAQVPLLREALVRSAELDALLAALPDAGTGITAGEGATLVFLETDAGRERLVRDGDAFRARRSGERFTREALDALLDQMPERFSANVLLRPVVESAILPTVAYVAGPGEYRYLTAQAAALYAPLGATAQVPVPRWAGTVIDARGDRLLDRLHLDAERVLEDDGTLARDILRRDLPSEVPAALATLRQAVTAASRMLDQAGRTIDPVLERAVAGRERKLAAVTDDLERLMERHLRKRDDIAHAQYRRLQAALRPGGAPQERRLTAASMLARYGDAWLDAVVRATEAWAG